MRIELPRMGHEATICPDGATAVAALDNPAVSAFFAHGTNVIPANSTTLVSLGTAIGLTSDQVTVLVQEASAISIP